MSRSPAETHVAVLMGGLSSEREVSLSSGKGCAEALEAAGFRVSRVDAGRDLANVLSGLIKPDVVFNALHGKWGEDGCVQGVLETLGIPYTHSGVLASALAMDKDKSKAVLKAAGVKVPGGGLFDRHEVARRHVIPPPYIIKPNAEGSSVGVYLVRDAAERRRMVEQAYQYYKSFDNVFGGPGIVAGLAIGAASIAVAILAYRRLPKGRLRGFAVAAILIVGSQIYNAVRQVDDIDDYIDLSIDERLITGFLGTGKTTSIRSLLQHRPAHERTTRHAAAWVRWIFAGPGRNA